MPRTLGDSLIHRSHVDLMIEGGELHHPIHKRNFPEVGEAERRIGELIAANLVDDGATLQMGIGAIPDAALTALADHRDLGIHTEMFSDGLLPLIGGYGGRKKRHTTFGLSGQNRVHWSLLRAE